MKNITKIIIMICAANLLGLYKISTVIAEESKNNDDYYSILQPGIHPSAPLGNPNNTNNSVTTSNNDNDLENPDTDYYRSLKEEAFERLLESKIPLTPQQIIRYSKELDKSKRAIYTNPNTPPEPISSTINLDLSPGSQPPIIRLATGFVSSLIFIDSTGQPWPISDYSLGNPTDLNIQWDKKTNALFIQSINNYVTGNLAVRLAKLETPIMISLVTGQRQVDFRVDLQIRKRGPNALSIVSSSDYGQMLTSPSLLKVLDGIPPENSKELKVLHNLGRAWLHNNKMIFRTNLTILSPAWSANVASADGTQVYELNPTPLILASKDGKTIKIEISGF